MARRDEVARLAGVSPAEVREVAVEEVRSALAGRVSVVVLEVATQEPATYWLAGGRHYLDDPYFGPVIAIEDLGYDPTLGLHPREGG